MKFNYQARTKEGDIQTGVVEASSEETAISLLQKHGLFVTYLKEFKPPFYAKRVKLFRGISAKDLVLFSRQLSIMFTSKVTLVEALKVLASQTENLDLQEKILNLIEEVEGGSSFSKALSKHQDIFSPFYVAMVRAGEASGKMAESLNYLADHLEREYHLASRTKGALLYPSLVVFVIVLVMVLMIYFVIPSLKEVIMSTEAQIPKVTLVVISASEFLRRFGLFILLGVFILLISIFRYYRTEQGKDFFDKIFLKLPLFSPLLKIIYISRFAENLSTLISGGLLITQALELSANVVGSSIYKNAILSITNEVRKGVPTSAVMALYPQIFPPIFIQMTLIGEKTGTLDTTLMSIASFYQREVERSIENLLSILEPALIIFLGAVVGGMMLSILMPLYSTVSM